MHPVTKALQLLMLALTAALLVATSATCPEESARFAIEGTCGPSGTFTVSTTDATCDVTTTGTEVLLPVEGRLSTGGGGLANAGFSLNGPITVPDGGLLRLDGGAFVRSNRGVLRLQRTCHGFSPDAGSFLLWCTTSGDSVQTEACESTLTLVE